MNQHTPPLSSTSNVFALMALAAELLTSCSPQNIGSLADTAPAPDGPPADAATSSVPGPAPVPPPSPDAGSAAPAPAPPGVCPPGLATPAEIAATPRANHNLEMLALKVSRGKLVADQAIYDRIVRDVPAIRATHPALADYGYRAPDSGDSMLMYVTAATLQQMRNRTYQPWVCPNRLYGALEDKFRLGAVPGGLIVLEFKGTYNMQLLSQEYARMPGVEMALPNGYGPGPGVGFGRRNICATPDGAIYHYVFANFMAYGGIFVYFTVASDGAITEAGNFEGTDLTGAPEWLHRYVTADSCEAPPRRR